MGLKENDKIFLCLVLTISMSGCASSQKQLQLPSWEGKYTRTDGRYDLHMDLSSGLLEVTFLKRGLSPAEPTVSRGRFLAKVNGNSAKEMQLCRQGLCAKECLSFFHRSLNGIEYDSCTDDDMEGLYR
jgi:hypothetical protein